MKGTKAPRAPVLDASLAPPRRHASFHAGKDEGVDLVDASNPEAAELPLGLDLR